MRNWTVTFLFLLVAATIQSAETAQPKPLLALEPEKYEDAPIFIFRTGSSPKTVSPWGPFTSYQVNVGADGQNITGDAANECSITIDPSNPSRMSIGWRQFNSVFSNFRQGGWAYTTNGGTSWTFPGVLENNSFR